MFEDLTVKMMTDHQGRQGGVGVRSGGRRSGKPTVTRERKNRHAVLLLRNH